MTHILLSRAAAVLRVTGDDAATFLQGQFTHELRRGTGSVVYGLFLNQKGKVVADAHVLRLAEQEFLVVSCFSSAELIKRRLEEYIIADDVSVTDETATMHALTLWGPASAERLGDKPQDGRLVRQGGAFVFAGRRVGGENYEIIGPGKEILEWHGRFHAAGCIETDAGLAEFARITAGIPAIPQDIGPADLPNEGNLEEVAISYTKGCYLGQEVMARLKNLGQVRRRLFVLCGMGKAPEPQSPLYQGGRKHGEIRSVAHRGEEFVALAMLSLLNLDQAGGLGLAPDAAPTLRIISRG